MNPGHSLHLSNHALEILPRHLGARPAWLDGLRINMTGLSGSSPSKCPTVPGKGPLDI